MRKTFGQHTFSKFTAHTAAGFYRAFFCDKLYMHKHLANLSTEVLETELEITSRIKVNKCLVLMRIMYS